MNKKWSKRLCSFLLAAAMVFSSMAGLQLSSVTVAAEQGSGTQETKVTAEPVTLESELGNIVLKQTEVNETAATLVIENVNDILEKGNAEAVSVTAQMFYEDTVTQTVTETMELKQDTTDYSIDFENFGKFKVQVAYLKNGKAVGAAQETWFGIVAEEYNLAPISATFPAVLFSLSLWEGAEIENADGSKAGICITQSAGGEPIPTIAVFERADSWDWDSLPKNVYKLPTADPSDFSGVTWGGQKWLNARKKMSSYIRDLYEVSPNAKFNLYSTDNFVENVLTLIVANKIPESQYRAILLSDGSGTYAYFNNTFQGENPGELYNSMRADWTAIKERTRQEGKFDPSWAKYSDSGNLASTCLPKYAAVAAEDENIDWWVARTRGTFSCSDETLLKKVTDSCTVKSVSAMLKAVQEIGKDKDFRKLYHFDDNMFSEAMEKGKPVMLILGTTVSSEQNFKDYARMVMEYYGDSYVYYYKGHPGTPTNLYPSKQKELQDLHVTDVDSSIPAELILFFFPDIYMCGYDSSTFQSVESEKMACGMFNMTKEQGLERTYGELLDYFASSIDAANEIYGSLCTEKDHVYYLLEFNDTEYQDIAIYDATANSFRYYKNTATTEGQYEWNTDVMANMTVEDIPSVAYTGEVIKPEVTVKSGSKVLKKDEDYSVSYGDNRLPGQGSVVIEGKGEYAGFGKVNKFFVIEKIDNPLAVTVEDIRYGEEIKPQITNPSEGSLTCVYKKKDAEDTEYSVNVPTEPGEYTIQVTSGYTDCYNSAVATADFVIRKVPVIKTLPAADPIVLGQPLSSAALAGGEADVEGIFSWKDGSVLPTLADSEKTLYKIVFTPKDTTQCTVEAEITVKVTTTEPSATPAATAEPSATPAVTTEPGGTPTATAGPSATPAATMEPGGTPTATAGPSGTPAATTEPGGTPTATAGPSATPAATTEPGGTPAATASIVPGGMPTATLPVSSGTPLPTATAAVSAGDDAATLKAGKKITVGKAKYTVKASGAKKTLSLIFTGLVNKKSKTGSVPKQVSYKGKTYPVTEIAAKAFVKNKSLTKVTIGSSVTKIGKKAFYNCKKLAKVTIKGTRISKIGSKAFAGISKKAKFKLPAKKKKTYNKMIKKAGFKGK